MKALERRPDRDGMPAWVEEVERDEDSDVLRADGAAVAARRTDRRTRRCRSAARGPIGSRRRPAGRDLTITEDGEVYNVFFRFMSRFVFGHHATMDAYLERTCRRGRSENDRESAKSSSAREAASTSSASSAGTRCWCWASRPTVSSWTNCASRGALRPHRRQQADGHDLRRCSVTETICAGCASLVPRLKADGVLWTLRPKGSPDLKEAEMMRAGQDAGLVDVKVVSFLRRRSPPRNSSSRWRTGPPIARPAAGSTVECPAGRAAGSPEQWNSMTAAI